MSARVWTIAGIDPTGQAGLIADLNTFKAFKVQASAITTAVTAQNAKTLIAIEAISATQLEAQLHVLQADHPLAIKIGMLGKSDMIEVLLAFLSHYQGQVVLDPLLSSSTGGSLIFEPLRTYRSQLIKLLPFIDVLMPNCFEAEMLLNCSLQTYDDLSKGAKALLDLGAKSVLLKGGHVSDPLFSQDYWTDGSASFWLANQRYLQKNYRGTGCVLSAAAAACLAQGYVLKDALVIAKMYVHRAIRLAKQLDAHTATVFHGGFPDEESDLPYLSPTPLKQHPHAFKRIKPGFYPIVDSSLWAKTLLPAGIKCLQLRLKNILPQRVEEEIKNAVFLARQHQVTLFINDYWNLAIQQKASGVHLGQDDLDEADIDMIRQAGLYLGVSTHCYHEVARAHALNPSYIAIGPIYPTTSKLMPFKPQGIEQLQYWQALLSYPLVAIGGINLERFPLVLQTKVAGISLISAISKAENPILASQAFLTTFSEFNHE